MDSFCYPLIMPITVIAAIAFLVNTPLGYMRSQTRKFSWQWFVWVHLSIPLIATCRIVSHISIKVIPLLFVSAICGQLLGGRLKPQA
jgi:hypothetical protein